MYSVGQTVTTPVAPGEDRTGQIVAILADGPYVVYVISYIAGANRHYCARMEGQFK